MERLGQVVVLARLRIESAKEPNLVLDDWTTDITTQVHFRKAVGRGTGEREVLHFTNQALGSAIAKQVAVKFIATALGDDVENTAGRLAVFGTVRTSLDFNFLHKLERQVGARATEGRVAGVHAVKNVVVLRTRRTRNRRITIAAGGITQA